MGADISRLKSKNLLSNSSDAVADPIKDLLGCDEAGGAICLLVRANGGVG